MKRLTRLATLALALVAAGAFAQTPQRGRLQANFASDFQTVPVMGNTPGLGGTFQTYVALLNPTTSSFPVNVSLYDTLGVKHDAVITLAAGELKTYANFLESVFQYVGGGAVTFSTPESAGGTHNNRFIANVEVRTGGTRFSTSIPVLEFAGSSSRSFSPGITVDSSSRVNVGCFNQSDAANVVKATVFDSTGKLTLGSVDMNLPANAWGQAPVNTIVNGGYVQFDPSESAVCYAVVVDNATNDGRFIPASEYKP